MSGESVENLKAKLKDCRAECDTLQREKMDLLTLTARLQNEIFALRHPTNLVKLRDDIERILAPALNVRAPYAKQIIDLLVELLAPAAGPCVGCGCAESSDGDWYRLCGTCRWKVTK